MCDDFDNSEVTTTEYYNPHFVTVLSGLATKVQVARILLSGISQARSKTGIDFNTDVRINILIDKDGKHRGYGYLWFDDVRLANVFLGKNPDGTERVERYLPKNRVRMYKKLEKEMDNLDMESWAELTEAEERIREKMESLYVVRKLDPLITLDEYGYNPRDVKEKLIYKPTEGRNIILGKLQFFLDPIKEKEGFERNMLFCSRVPDWVTEEDIYKIFRRYVTDKQARWVDPEGHRGDYPIVYINSTRGRRMATVVFENSPRGDALFAAKMERKADVLNPKTGKYETLIFTLKRK
jgi:hypothetical protein